ncbi:MAG: hypothetical protein ACYCO4_00005 [Sulfobacillus sp.]
MSIQLGLAPTIERAVADLAAKYPTDPPHAAHVADQAVLLFDLLARWHQLLPADRALLHHGGLLHDSGIWINGKGHHRHSAYIVRTDGLLADYPPAERDLLARLVQNHRKRPRPAPQYWPLERRLALVWLSALLRTADGLDVDHDQRAQVVAAYPDAHGYVVAVRGVDAGRFNQRLERKSQLLADLLGGDLRFSADQP